MMYLYLIAGLFVLALASKYLVDSAVVVAQKFRISNAVIGLTVIAAGTSFPELITSIVAALDGKSAIAIGNVVGSNIFNLLGILGLAAVISSCVINKDAKNIEIPVMLASYVLFLVLSFDQQLSRLDGFILFLSMLSFMVFSIKRNKQSNSSSSHVSNHKFYVNLGMLILSFIALVVGADLMLTGSVMFGQKLGLTDRIIGITIVAVATSLPEIGASISATLKGEKEMAVANVIGSNIFNTLGILGLTAIIQPIPLSNEMLKEDVMIMIASGILLIVLSLIKTSFAKKEGFLFLLLICSYFSFLIYK